MEIKITFTEEMLATLPGNKEIATDFVAAKNPNGPAADENAVIENMSEMLEKKTRYFARSVESGPYAPGLPFLYDYQVKGFFKGACKAMILTEAYTKEELKKLRLSLWTYKSSIDNLIHVGPRQIFFDLPEGANPQELSYCERPLLGQTMKGERVALVRSEAVPVGTSIVVTVLSLNPKLFGFVKAWLEFGELIGIGGWRSSGKGRFTFEILEQSAAEAKAQPAEPSPPKKKEKATAEKE